MTLPLTAIPGDEKTPNTPRPAIKSRIGILAPSTRFWIKLKSARLIDMKERAGEKHVFVMPGISA
ncbi:MAG: hypothetical protein Q8M95_05420 [Candidatus Methanoperedens sp.]|nr:hypothetical protein [Candidatus Methanoperedens sp.]